MSTTANTVNVIELFNGSIEQLVSFHDNAYGNRDAEETFRSIAEKNDVPKKTIDAGIQSGSIESGVWKLFLVRSKGA